MSTMKRKVPSSVRNKVLLLEDDAKHRDKKDFGLDNCDVVIGIFIPKATPIANASFSEVEAATNSDMELQ
ncbi:hypothetical protein SO802_012101 [Lithocarpus litseifolius]|uniref:Uncharacterized protein n=1 Tax=Lithocarpus litseifolius TaxID=425828 RepID=A0AAW2D5W2_9ROSI